MADLTLQHVLAGSPSTATPPAGMARALHNMQHWCWRHCCSASRAYRHCTPATAANASPPVIVKASDSLDVSAAPLYIAEDRGYFKGDGLDVQLVNVSRSVVVQAVATNQLQFGLTLPSPSLFNALEGGAPVKFVASAITNKEADRRSVAPGALCHGRANPGVSKGSCGRRATCCRAPRRKP